MTSNSANILARIDELMLDLVRQLATQVEVLRSSPIASSSSFSSAVDSTAPCQADVERSAKRAKQNKPKVTPLRMATLATTEGGVAAESNVCFPTKSVVGIRRFGTIRDETASDRTIALLVTLLGCTDRLQLNIVASPRGLVSGPLTLCPPCGEAIECRPGATTIIPTEISAGWSVDLRCEPGTHAGTHAQRHLVLIVEKEAAFKQIVQFRPDTKEVEGNGGGRIDWSKVVVVTAKGYPDCATRVLVQLLTASDCDVRVVGLFDGDPYGVDIARHFQSSGKVEWIGVDTAEFLPAPTGPSSSALVPLRNDERATAVRLLNSLKGSQEDELLLRNSGRVRLHIRSVVSVVHGSADSDERGGHEGDAAEPRGDGVAAAVEQVQLARKVERQVRQAGERGACVSGGEGAEAIAQGLAVDTHSADNIRD
nr:TPA_inf: SPO11 [Sporisorium graminicola]